MRAVAREDHPAMHEVRQPAALERVDRHQSSRKSACPTTRAIRGDHTVSGLRSASGSASQPSCRSIRQMLSGCLCSSADWPLLNGGSNQNQRSAGRSRLHLDIGDQEVVLEQLALEIEAQHPADRRIRAVAGDQLVGLELIGPSGVSIVDGGRGRTGVPSAVDLVRDPQVDRRARPARRSTRYSSK